MIMSAYTSIMEDQQNPLLRYFEGAHPWDTCTHRQVASQSRGCHREQRLQHTLSETVMFGDRLAWPAERGHLHLPPPGRRAGSAAWVHTPCSVTACRHATLIRSRHCASSSLRAAVQRLCASLSQQSYGSC